MDDRFQWLDEETDGRIGAALGCVQALIAILVVVIIYVIVRAL